MSDIFIDALLKSHAREGILGSVQESKQDFLEKGKKAQIGEIREWKGVKFQKQPNGGWIPVKQGTKETKKEGEVDWKKVTKEDIDNFPTGTKISYEDELSGETITSVKQEDGSWKDGEGNKWSSEEVKESVSHPDAHGHKIEKPAEGKKEKKEFSKDDEQFLKNFFDPFSVVDAFENEYNGEDATIEDFEKFMTSGGQAESMGVETLMSELNLSNEEATDLFRKRKEELIEKVKGNPEKYGFETKPENKAIAGVKDWIGDEASDQEISDVLDAVEDFVPASMLKIQANSPVQFGEKVYNRADEIMEKYQEHFDHWDGTDSMPDKQLRKILVAIMYDKRNPRT